MITCLPLFTSRDDLLTASIDDCLTAVINACLYLWLPLLMIYNGIPAGASTGGGAAALPALSRHDRRSIKQAAGARGRRGVSRKNHGCPTRAALVGARAGVLPASEAVVVKSGSKNTVFIPFLLPEIQWYSRAETARASTAFAPLEFGAGGAVVSRSRCGYIHTCICIYILPQKQRHQQVQARHIRLRSRTIMCVHFAAIAVNSQ